MRVARIELRGIGPFDDAVLEIPEPSGRGEVVLFEGPNGSGKTTIAQAIAVATGSPQAFGQDRGLLGSTQEDLFRRIREKDGRMDVVLQHEDHSLRVGVTRAGFDRSELAQSASPPRPVVSKLLELHSASTERVTSWAAFAYRGHVYTANLGANGPQIIAHSAFSNALSFGSGAPASSILGQYLTNIEFDRIQAKLYAAERPEHPEARRMQAAAASHKETLDRLQHAFSRVLDRRVEIDFPLGNRAPRILFDGQELPIDLLGEGLRNTFSWLADLLVRLERTPWASPEVSPFDQEFWLILDEIEESLHPRMQARLLPILRETFPNARIYATTHSPFIVASLGEGCVFSIRPDPKTRRVQGAIQATTLEHGRSLEWVVSAIFDAPAGFVDEETREKLAAHQEGVAALRRGSAIDWDSFLSVRAWLFDLNEEVRAVVASREVPVRAQIAAKLQERAA